MRSLSGPAWAYVCLVVAAAIAQFVRGSYDGLDLGGFLVLALLLLAFESIPVLLSPTVVSVSVSAVLASVVLLGPTGAALVGATALLIPRGGLRPIQRLFNAAQLALCAYAAGLVYLACGAHVGPPHAAEFPAVILPFAVAALAYNGLNGLLVGGIVVLTSGRSAISLRNVRWRKFASMAGSYLGYCALGLPIAALWGTVGWFSAILVLLPLFIARWALVQYGAQQKAYAATIAALCQAVETKDLYTRGHCVRVSQGSVMIAEEIGMRADRLDALRYAGMLHDVGKLGVPTRVLQKSGPLTEDEYAAIQLHPMRGLEIVRQIGFLDEALAGILHHHERMDGKGYPMGLAGREIPQFARIIGVADALDSMTSTRSYRGARSVSQAISELRRWSGTQFDPEMVDALVRAIERDGWDPPRPLGLPPIGEVVGEHDHDDPSEPLRVLDEHRK